jgi:hypothetical protein
MAEKGKDVEITPKSKLLNAGGNQQFTAKVKDESNQDVKWSIEGMGRTEDMGLSAGTTISDAGLLTLAAGEKCYRVNVTATSKANEKKYGVATVVLTANTNSGIDDMVNDYLLDNEFDTLEEALASIVAIGQARLKDKESKWSLSSSESIELNAYSWGVTDISGKAFTEAQVGIGTGIAAVAGNMAVLSQVAKINNCEGEIADQWDAASGVSHSMVIAKMAGLTLFT